MATTRTATTGRTSMFIAESGDFFVVELPIAVLVEIEEKSP